MSQGKWKYHEQESTLAVKKLQLKLTPADIVILQQAAEACGFKDYHTYLRRLILVLPKQINKPFTCHEKYDPTNHKIQISEDLFKFYDKLACSHSTTVTSIISKYVVYPAIWAFMTDKDIKPSCI